MDNENQPIDVSIDIETYSLDIPNAAVISFACCTHDSSLEIYLNRFEQVDLRRDFDEETADWHRNMHMQWWHNSLTWTDEMHGVMAVYAFHTLNEWFRQHVGNAACNVWMKPPCFDSEILSHLAKQVNCKLPWTFREERDIRTLQAIAHAPDLPEKPDNAHDALVDAKYQLEIVTRCKDWLYRTH